MSEAAQEAETAPDAAAPPSPTDRPATGGTLQTAGFGVERWTREDPRRRGRLARELRLVAEMDPDELHAAEQARRAKDAAELEKELKGLARRNRWNTYAATRAVEHVAASLDRLKPQQDPGGRISGWWPSGHLNLLMAGPSSHGKTDAAYAITNHVAETSRDDDQGPVLHVRTWNAVEMGKALLLQDQDPGGALLKEVLECDLLCIDDVHARHYTAGWAELIYQIMTTRTANRRRTILALNAAQRADIDPVLSTCFGDLAGPVLMRIRQDCVAAWIEGEPLRGYATWSAATMFD